MMILLNTSILTSYGSYTYELLSLGEARAMIADGFESAIGHQSTAEILSELLEVPVFVNRLNYVQQPGQQAIVFKLKTRAPEGAILSREEIEAIGYEFGLLARRA